MKTSLQSLPQKKVTAGLSKLQQAGVTARMWLAMLDGGDSVMQRLVAAWPRQPDVFDAVSLLGFGEEAEENLPDAKPGEIVLRYGGWSLGELRAKQPDLMWNQDWYDRYAWSGEQLPSGIYVLRLPVPESNRKRFEEQTTLLLSDEEPAPVVLAASALLAIRVSGGDDPLQGGFARCKERTDDGYRVGLYWYDRRLGVNGCWDDGRGDGVWRSAARRTS